MKLLLENWRKYVNEVAMGFDMAKSIEYTAFILDKASHQKLAQLAPEGWKLFAHHMTMIPPTEQKQRLKPDEKDEEAYRAYFVSHRKWREIRDKHMDPHWERVNKLGEYADGPAMDVFMDAVQARVDGTGSREEMLQKKEAWKDALYNSVNASVELRSVLTSLLNKALKADVKPPRAWLDGETGLIKMLEMDVKYVARNLRNVYDAEQRGY
jgi:hypothetical protein